MDFKAIDYKNIPVQADTLSGIVRLDMESNSCLSELDSYISSDQGVATLVLRVVNSPLYNRGRQIYSIPAAISVLGFNMIRSLAMLAFSRSLFSQSKSHLFGVHIWQHSLLTAIASQTICQALSDEKDKDEAFIAGLVHDIGKVMLFKHNNSHYLDVLTLILEKGCICVEAERQVFGCDHCQVGREAVAQWKLPAHFADYMGVDITVPRPEFSTSPVMLSLASANCLIEGAGIGAQASANPESSKATLMAFGLDETLIEQYLREEFMVSLMGNETYQLCANL